MRWLESALSVLVISIAGYAAWFYLDTGDLPFGLGGILEESRSTDTATQGPSAQALVNLSEGVVEVRAQELFGYVTVGRGTGIIVDAAPRWRILTASHVLATNLVGIRRPGKSQWIGVEVLTRDEGPDIALLETSGQIDVPPTTVPPLAADTPALGDPVFLACFFDTEIRAGRVLDKVVRIGSTLNLVVDIPSEPGCSGGPLVNARGELVGIVIKASPEATVAVTVSRELLASSPSE